jgi:hypothetical protein
MHFTVAPNPIATTLPNCDRRQIKTPRTNTQPFKCWLKQVETMRQGLLGKML